MRKKSKSVCLSHKCVCIRHVHWTYVCVCVCVYTEKSFNVEEMSEC